MGNSLRCCLACVLPCGALDLIRIVHLNGYVEEITRIVTAGEILQAYPNHVLSKPSSQGNMVRKIMILSPESELKRGSIYFLIPDSSLPSKKPHSSTKKNKINGPKLIVHEDHHDDELSKSKSISEDNNSKVLSIDLSKLEDDHENSNNNNNNVVVCETKLFKSKSKSGKHQRRRSSRGKSGIWQPHLEIITEDL